MRGIFGRARAGRASGFLAALAVVAALPAAAAEAPAGVARAAAGRPAAPPEALGATVFDDWRLTCGPDACAIHAAVRGAGADAAEVLRLQVARAPDLAEGFAVSIETALPLLVADPAALTIGSEPERSIPWRICAPDGCEARAELDADLLSGLRRARAANVALTLADGIRVRVEISLIGFSAAWRALGAS